MNVNNFTLDQTINLTLAQLASLFLDEETQGSSAQANASGEIGTVAQTIDSPCTGEIPVPAATCVCVGEIVVSAPDAPTDCLGLHLGHGRVYVGWQHANQDSVDYFEVYAGLSPGGPYFPYPIPRRNSLFTFLDNVPIGIALYLQIRAVGHNGLASGFSSVKRGVFAPIEGTLQVRAVSGTTIGAGVRFSKVHPESGEPITFKAVNDILVN